jgi:Tfp pilus assembly protein PilN
MINLLPPRAKQNYLYGRRNTTLRVWAVAFAFGLLGVGAIASFGMFTMQHNVNILTQQVASSQHTLKDEKLDDVQKQVQDLTSSLKLVTQVLSKEILFSKLIKQIGNAVPANANLTGLSINQVQGGIDLTAIATDYNAATQVQVNLQDPANKIFSKADIQAITCGGNSSSTDPNYPCTVTIRALFAKDNPFLFINSTGGQ